MFITRSIFFGNKATAGSNCIYFSGNLFNVTNTQFGGMDNYRVDEETYGYKPFTFGGAVQIGAEMSFFTNVSFTSNSATYAGALGKLNS